MVGEGFRKKRGSHDESVGARSERVRNVGDSLRVGIKLPDQMDGFGLRWIKLFRQWRRAGKMRIARGVVESGAAKSAYFIASFKGV